jgi:hypothetical protein
MHSELHEGCIKKSRAGHATGCRTGEGVQIAAECECAMLKIVKEQEKKMQAKPAMPHSR